MVRTFGPNRSDEDDILNDMIENTEVTDAQFPKRQVAGEWRLNSDQYLAVPCPAGGLVCQLLFDGLFDSPSIKDPDISELLKRGRVEFDVEGHRVDSVPDLLAVCSIMILGLPSEVDPV